MEISCCSCAGIALKLSSILLWLVLSATASYNFSSSNSKCPVRPRDTNRKFLFTILIATSDGDNHPFMDVLCVDATHSKNFTATLRNESRTVRNPQKDSPSQVTTFAFSPTSTIWVLKAGGRVTLTTIVSREGSLQNSSGSLPVFNWHIITCSQLLSSSSFNMYMMATLH